jgi:hypothetical protein
MILAWLLAGPASALLEDWASRLSALVSVLVQHQLSHGR